MFEAPAIIGTCLNCIAPGSLSAMLALIFVGACIALTAERRKPALGATTNNRRPKLYCNGVQTDRDFWVHPDEER